MNQHDYEQLLELADQQLLELSDTVAQLRQAYHQLAEENNQLKITNHDLREMMSTVHPAEEEKQSAEIEQQITGGKNRLQGFYDQGIHICHQYFGLSRSPEEGCIFCQDVLDGLED
ncbi:initiation control protein YabA [Hutsoniella sourekii]|uniref:initiation control protein YabA n=1 Tax=Hutsoniella sourekii TaxID=87650 RepID=UPI0004805A49|nr:initiation control protein YabA [Hutsoniella sourekii]